MEIKNADGNVLYRMKECIDDFEYKIRDASTGQLRTIKLREKRIVTYNPSLAKKQIYEINKEIEKAKLLKASQAKKMSTATAPNTLSFLPQTKKEMKQTGKSRCRSMRN